NDTAAAIVSFRAAGKKTQAGANVFFQLYTQLSAQDDAAATEEAGQALRRALELSPGNLAIAVEWLKFLARTQDTEIVNYLETFRTLAQPIISRNKSPIPKLLETAKLAAQEGQWPKAELQTSFLRNVIVAEIAFQHSLHVLEPHALEFVRLEFEPQTLAEFKSSASSTASTHTLSALQMVERKLPDTQLGEISAIASEDFDLDGHFDLWTAAGKNLRIISLAPALDGDNQNSTDNAAEEQKSHGFTTLCQTELSISASGLAMADLDRDFQHRKDSLPASALPTTTPPATEQDLPNSSVQLTQEQLIEKYLDTDLDLIVYGAGGVRFYRNDLDIDSGTRSFTEMPQAAPLSELTDVHSVAVIDFDHDADLDVAISSGQGISLWSNRGDWTFADFSSYSQLPPISTDVTEIVALDVDRNVLNDFLLAVPASSESFVLKSNLHGRYFLQSHLWKEEGFGGQASLAATDANADACWDVIGCGAEGTQLTLMKSIGHHAWQPNSKSQLSATPMQGVLVDDFDNDSRDDYLAWGEQGIEFFRQNANGVVTKDEQVLSVGEDTLQVATLDA
ncbi:MAG: VCBS repeat-containing protein, partial [Aureliella sp.]